MPLPRRLLVEDRADSPDGRGRGTRDEDGADRRSRIPKRDPSWRRPARRRVIAIRDRLRELYGRPVNEPHGHPVAELVRTVLSQNTSDRNRDLAFGRMRERFPTWEEVRDAPLDELEEALRPGGLAPTKAPRIQAILAGLDDHPDLDWLERAPRDEAIEFLTSLPGVGRKTAACVMIFTFDRPEIPVDTHVHRVGGRLGLFREGASFEEAHDEMLAITPPEDAYELHINLIRHGRAVCRPRPRCAECGLRRMCPWWRRRRGGSGT
jgi:endonuclease-3